MRKDLDMLLWPRVSRHWTSCSEVWTRWEEKSTEQMSVNVLCSDDNR